MRRLLLATALVAAPALAADIPSQPQPIAAAAPGTLSPADQAAYKAIFAAIRAHDWAGAAAGLDARPGGLLTPIARAELILAKGSPRADAATLAALVKAAPDLPEASQLARLARARGAEGLAALPAEHDLVRMAGASRRQSARPTHEDPALAARLIPLLKTNAAGAAEPLVEAAADHLSTDALTEWRERVAWGYFLAGDDASARRVAAVAREGSGDWAVQAAWVQGLAAWRAGDMAAAADAFGAVATRADDPELKAAGLFWAARSDTAGGHPERVAPRLRAASHLSETFYGLLAGAALGIAPEPRFAGLDPGFAALLDRPNAQVATALAAIGETTLADEVLRWQARIGDPAEHGALVALAGALHLPAAKVWLAMNAPPGTASTVSARFPLPGWSPAKGWRVDPALCFAQALQESQFRPDAVSRAGARGLMQLMPGTMRLVARHKGDATADPASLDDPAVSLEYGQSYLEELADNAGTGGLLPKVIAAYNAGPNNDAGWAARAGASNDPLLFIESIPFVETRLYVATVLRNYWMYQREMGARRDSLAAMAEGRWPRFPTATVTRTAFSTAAADTTD